MLGMCNSVRENFSEIKFCSIIQVDDVINHAKYLFNRFTRVSLARGQTLLFSVVNRGWPLQLLYILPYNCDNNTVNTVYVHVNDKSGWDGPPDIVGTNATGNAVEFIHMI